MQTQAYFDNIQSQLIQALSEAKHHIRIAVAWFTDREILQVLETQASKGIKVSLILMNDHINRGDYGLDFSRLLQNNGTVLWIGEGKADEDLMHNKFVVIDQDTVITGSYNWSRKAQRNHENITISQESPELAEQFLAEFTFLQGKYSKGQASEESPDFSKILKRIEILKNTIALEDEDDIEYQILKIRKLLPQNIGNFQTLAQLPQILTFVQKQEYAKAIPLIQDFIHHFNRLSLYEDPELNALKLEIKMLEIRLASLEDEKTDLEKLIRTFQIRYDQELGVLILEILAKRRAKAQKEAKENPADAEKQARQAETEEDYQQYQQNYQQSKQKKLAVLSQSESQNLKKMYRQASKLCHPDIVAEEFKAEAEEVFIHLDKAYKEQDLPKVQEILSNLQKGIFRTQSQSISEKESLKAVLGKMKIKIEEIVQAVQNLKSSDAYQKIEHISDWDEYFSEMKETLEEELKVV